LRIDVDVYAATYHTLVQLYPTLSRGGFVLFDDVKLAYACKAMADFRKQFNKYVTVGYDSQTGISTLRVEAFTPQDAQKTAAAMLDSGELTYMNLVHLAGCDGTDPDSMTQQEIEGRSQAMLAIEALKRFTPGCENARLRNFGMTIGIRDTRKIDAVYNLTEHDVREQARFEDSIGIYPEFIDGYGILILPTTGRYMHIPYRSMLPKGVKNLLVTGRALAGERVADRATGVVAMPARGLHQRVQQPTLLRPPGLRILAGEPLRNLTARSHRQLPAHIAREHESLRGPSYVRHTLPLPDLLRESSRGAASAETETYDR
jgi:hypothetical protein